MQHVMVPCPEEHVDELRAGLLRLTLGSAGWTDENLDAFLTGLDERSRQLVVAVARPSSEDGHLTYRAAARSLGIEVGEVLDLVTEINDHCRREGYPPPLITETKDVRAADGEQGPAPVISIFRVVARKMLSRLGIDPESASNP